MTKINFKNLPALPVTRLQRNLLAVTTGILLISNLWMVFSMSSQDKIVVISPSVDKEIVVGTNYVSEDYLYLRATQISDLLFNLRLENYNYNIEQILRQVDSKQKAEFSQQLNEFAKDIKTKRYFYTFSKDSYEIDNRNLNVTISGYLDTYLNNKKLSTNYKTYRLHFENQSGLVKLISFEEINSDKS